jgi:hypothetical protein
MINFDKAAEDLKEVLEGTPVLFWLVKPNVMDDDYSYIFRFKNTANNFKWAIEFCEDEVTQLAIAEEDMTPYLTEYVKHNLPDLLFSVPRLARKRRSDVV